MATGIFVQSAGAIDLPSGFHDSVAIEGLEEPTNFRFAPDGKIYVAEKSGLILEYDSLSDKTPETFADLRTKVYNADDRGLLGLAVDPQFPIKPYIYALYTYDHILGNSTPAPVWGKANQDGDACPAPEGSCLVSGRLVRLTANASGHQATAESVLLEGWCQQFSSHSVGDLQFGPEGALYVSGGEGASYLSADYGQFGSQIGPGGPIHKNPCGDPPGGENLTPPTAEGGALRSLDAFTPGDPTGLSGALLRIDPDTAEGWPGNPMAASSDPNMRRIIGFGFRNPFRFAIDPKTSTVNVGNVGWNDFEELDRFPIPTGSGAAYDSGWPCYEGRKRLFLYQQLELNLCESLYSLPGSTSEPFFYYAHQSGVTPEDPCPDEGSAISAILPYHGGTFPGAYENAIFFADSPRGCIYVMHADGGGTPDPLSVEPFLTNGGSYPGTGIQQGPEGDLFYSALGVEGPNEGAIHRVSFDPEAPDARLTANRLWGEESPLNVTFDASGSSSPLKHQLQYDWDLDGNGSFESLDEGPIVTKAISGPGSKVISVRVKDEVSGKTSVAHLTIFPGDTPPKVTITQPGGGLLWKVGQQIAFAGFAKEAGGGSVPVKKLYWKVRLLHCPAGCHAHPLTAFPATETGSFIAPNHDYPSEILISLTATDEEGLSGTTTVAIKPETVHLQFASKPSGIRLTAGLSDQLTPFELTSIRNSQLTVTAPQTVGIGGTEYAFQKWSDGGARVHTIVANSTATYTAIYAGGAGSPSPARDRPPQSRLLRRPAKRTHRSTARFAFAADQAGSRFECRLDGRRFKRCRSPRVYRHLNPGGHVFKVRAINPRGTVERRPAAFAWRVLP